ncbi:translocation protein SEC62 isoform X2 [Bactrocera neohumeralis]|uniref:translocation protein SEC62 isoform X2 n=1 Tax=Bactrocera neohumeralis TaxID=98809 RepID=UPI002164FDDF|nr:translocation protein SEC62 isoform X2 [Bactrocera neohumeralis]
MSEKKRSRRRKDEYTGPGEQEVEKPSKEEFKVAKWMKANVKSKKTKFLSHNVQYFISNKALDALLKSKFAQGNDALFTTREQAIEFLDVMLEHKFFHRAKKVPVSLEEMRGSGATTGSKTTKNKSDEKEPQHKKKEKDEKKDTEAEAEASGANGMGDGNISAGAGSGGGGAVEKKEKRKRKIRLDMHHEQVFVDGSEPYIWIYDPIPIHYWIYGLILLLGAILICLFPLWPPLLRKGVYYLSVAAAGFLVLILTLTVIRLIVFTLVWLVTYGKLHFWLLPNLTEDVGFFASFWPLYESNYVAEEEKSKSSEKRNKSKSKKKEKDSDAEEDTAPEAIPLEAEKIEEVKEHDADIELRRRKATGDNTACAVEAASSSAADGVDNSEATAESDVKGSHTPSESDSEISAKDQFEIISSSEVHNVN